MTKVCSACKVEKNHSEFYKRNNRISGVTSKCIVCCKKANKNSKRDVDKTRNYDLKRVYGIDIDEFNKLLGKQGGVCAICGKSAEEKMKGKKKYLCVDHCHQTGKIRGLLCDPCNRAIGLLKEDIKNLNNAINYLL